MSLAIGTQGTLIEVEALPKGSGVWKEVEEIQSIGATGASSPEINVTHLRSTGKEFLLGLPDYGTLPMQGNFLGVGSAGQDEMLAAFDDRAERNFRVTLIDSTVMTFGGRVSAYGPGAQADSKWDLNVSIRVTGKVTYT